MNDTLYKDGVAPRSGRERAAKLKKAQERSNIKDFVREQEGKDIRELMGLASARRVLRRVLGPEITDLMGDNSDSRIVGVRINRILEQAQPKAWDILNATKENDENGHRY